MKARTPCKHCGKLTTRASGYCQGRTDCHQAELGLIPSTPPERPKRKWPKNVVQQEFLQRMHDKYGL